MREIEPHFDPEVIAALIDGRLTGEAREQAIHQLAESEAAFEAFAEALRSRAGAHATAPTPVPFVRRRRIPAVRPLAAAAVVLLLVGGSISVYLIRQDGGSAPAARLVAAVIDRNPVLAEGWSQRGWSVTRGGPSRLVEPSLAFRLGVRTVDLHLALALGDTSEAQVFLGEIAGWLAEIDLSQLVQARYERLGEQLAGEEPADILGLAAEAEQSLEGFLASPSFRLGRWSEAALVSAREGVPDLFESSQTEQFLERQASMHPDATAGAVRQIAELIQRLIQNGIDPSEYRALEDHLLELIAANAG